MEDEQEPDEADTVLLLERLNFPIEIAEGVLEESCNILEGSPLLCHITRLSGCSNKLSEVTVGFLGKSSI